MLKLSKICLVFYGIYLFVYFWYHFVPLPFILLSLIVSIISILIMMFWTFLAILKQRDWKRRFLTLFLFALPLIGFQLIRSIDSQKKVFFSAASDGVVSGSCITFYENKKMDYCSLSLIGEFCYPGTYEFENNTFYVNYTNNTPRLKSTKMVINDSELWFIDENNETEYKFDVDL